MYDFSYKRGINAAVDDIDDSDSIYLNKKYLWSGLGYACACDRCWDPWRV